MNLRGRAILLRAVVTLILLILAGRLTWVQVVKSEEITRRGEEMRLSRIDLTPLRGSIFDRRGIPIAVSVPKHAVVANTFQIEDIPGTASKLAPLLAPAPDQVAATAARVEKELRGHPRSGWVPLQRGLSQDEALKVTSARIPGVSTVPESERFYPQGTAANQVIGYVTPDGNQGEYGLEARYEKELRGQPGYVRAEVTLHNTPIEDTVKELVPSKPGLDLVLTIDVALQQMVEAKLEEVIKQTKAKRGLIIAMDVHTGEILVMAMRPGANPGDRNNWLNKEKKIDFDRLVNWAVTPMPPGSIFKTITSAIALEERAITLESTFLDNGIMVIDGWPIRNWDQVVKPQPKPMNLAELLAASSNIGLIQVGQRIPNDTFVRYLKGFGFMDPTGLDFSHEGAGTGLSNFENKAKVDWANMYIGQHLEVTPIQMVTAVAAIANGGKLVQPHLVREVRDPDGRVVRATPTGQRRQVLSEATAKEVQQLMVHVVQKGTGNLAQAPGYLVGGKTGTAQKPDLVKGGYKDRFIADFVGFAPANNPQIAVLVIIDEPEGQGYGGLIAAPLFGQLIPHVMQAVGIPADSAAAKGTETAPPKAVNGVVPNLVGLPLNWAQDRLAAAGFSVKSTGGGPVVTAQSLKPGAATKTGTIVELTLSPRDPKLGEAVLVPDFTGLSIAEASQLASEVGLTEKPTGSGFVVSQEPPAGSHVAPRSPLSLRLAPRAR